MRRISLSASNESKFQFALAPKNLLPFMPDYQWMSISIWTFTYLVTILEWPWCIIFARIDAFLYDAAFPFVLLLHLPLVTDS